MTQIFDPESGGVTSVTVIEAGPCPVVQLKTEETDGYDAIQLAFEPVAARKITKAEAGHLRKSEVEPHRHLVEFRGETPFVVGETVTVEAFEPGDKIKVTGISKGKGFAGTIKRHNFHRGRSRTARHNIRKPGSIGDLGLPGARVQGTEDARRLGGKRRTQIGLTVHSTDLERNLILVKGAVPGRRTGSSRSERNPVKMRRISTGF